MRNTDSPAFPFAATLSLLAAMLAVGTPRWVHAQSSALSTTPAATQPLAASCEALQTQIENKIRAAGVSSVSLEIVDSAAAVGRRVVGSCGMGSRKIVYATAAPHPATAVAPPPPLLPSETPKSVSGAAQNSPKPAPAVSPGPAATPRTAAVRDSVATTSSKAKAGVIWTECKDGSLTLGECKKK